MNSSPDKERSRCLGILSEAVTKAGGILFLKERTKVRYDFLGCTMETTVMSIRPSEETLWDEPGFSIGEDVTTQLLDTNELKKLIQRI